MAVEYFFYAKRKSCTLRKSNNKSSIAIAERLLLYQKAIAKMELDSSSSMSGSYRDLLVVCRI
jgi:hypothetical protein